MDFTEAFGSVNYSNRKITLEFIGVDPWDDHYELETNARNLLHGQKMQIRFDEDDSFYYIGRISVDSWVYRKRGGKVKMTIDADPWKYKDRSIEIYGNGSSYVELAVVNSGIRNAVPTIIPKSTLDVKIGGEAVRITASVESYKNNNLYFEPGNNTLEYRGNANVDLATVTWTEVQL